MFSAVRYLLRRLLRAALTLLVVATFDFWLFRLLPGNYAQLILRAGIFNPPALATLNHQLGLDQSLPVQYVHYLANIFTLDWGTSFVTHQAVASLVIQALGNTLILITLAYVLTLIIGVVLGVLAGGKPGGARDSIIVTTSLALWSMPTFWLGLVLVYVFSVWIGGLPVAGMTTIGTSYTGVQLIGDVGIHLILPTVTLVIGAVAQYALIMRNSLVGAMQEDYVTTARAKGLSGSRVLWRHAVPNAVLPTFTLTWLNIGIFLSTTLQVEIVFSWPGLGLLMYQSVNQRDYPVLQFAFLTIAAIVIVANMLSDVCYPFLDPRIRRR